MQRNFAAQTGFILFGLGHCDQRARLFHPVAPRGFFEKGNAQPRWKREGSRRILAACQTSTRGMPEKPPKGSHNPSQKSLQRWDNEGGAPKGGWDRGSARQKKTAKRNLQAHKSTRSKAR